MSPPAAKASSPAPRRITQRTSGVSATRRSAAERPRHIAAFYRVELARIVQGDGGDAVGEFVRNL